VSAGWAWVWLLPLALFSAALVLLPLLDRRRAAPPRAAHDAAVYRAQLQELGRDRELGRIGASEYDAAVLEVQRRLLALPDAAEPAPAGKPARWPVVAGALAIPALALALYLPRGTPDMPDFPLAQMAAQRDREAAEVAQLTTALRARLAELPENSPQRWNGLVLLGNTARATGDIPGAAAAYREALGISFDPRVATDLSELLMMAEGGQVNPEAQALLARAAPAAGEDPRPEFYLGLAERQAGDTAAALARWRALAARGPAEAPWQPLLRQRILEAEAVAAAPGPRAEDVAAAAQLPAEAQAAMVRGMVERLRTRLGEQPDDGEGWLRLARAERVLGNLGGAMVALANAERLLPGDARVSEERRALASGERPAGG
jgi:cytochrome c-type biogenesis protein CcmH